MAMNGQPMMKSAVDDLLRALHIQHNQFLPNEGDPEHPFFPKPDFNRGHMYKVLNGRILFPGDSLFVSESACNCFWKLR